MTAPVNAATLTRAPTLAARVRARLHAGAPWGAAHALIATLLLWVGSHAFGLPIYHSYDDPMLDMIVNGYATVGHPDRHLLFSHVWLGDVLLTARRVFASDRVYGAHIVFGAWLGAFCGVYALFRLARDRSGLALAFAVAALVVPLPSARPQFTYTAGMLAGGAGVLVASLVLAPPRGRWGGVPAWLLAICAAFYALLTRDAAFVAVGIAVAAPLAVLCWRGTRRARVVAATAAVLLTAVVAGTRAVDARAYDTPEWKRYWVQRESLKWFYDYPRVAPTPRVRPALDSAGWTPNDLALLHVMYLPPPVDFSTSKARPVLAAAPLWRGERAVAASVSGSLHTLILEPRVAPLTAACAMLLFALWASARGSAMSYAAGLACAGAAFVGVAVLGREYHQTVPRVYQPPLSALAWLGGALVLAAPLGRSRRRVVRAAAAAIGIVAAAQAAFYVHFAGNAARYVALTSGDMARLAPRRDEWYVVQDVGLPMAYLVEPAGSDPRFRAGRWAWLSALQMTPTGWAMFQRAGITDLSHALVSRADVHLVADSATRVLLRRMYREHYGLDVVMCERMRGRSFVVADVRRAQAQEAPPGCTPLP